MPRSERPRDLLRFGDFELDPATGELNHAGSTFRLQPQPLKVLLALVRNSGRLVTREELKLEVDPDTTFGDSDHAINLAVTKLRSALQDSAESPHFIDTLPRRGYRFLAPVERSSGEPPTVAPKLPERRNRKPIWIALGMAIVVACVIVVLTVRRSRLEAQPASVVVAAFTNRTAEPAFDSTMRSGFSAQLQQSTFLDLLSDEEIEEVLSLMERPKNTLLTTEVAREVCQRVGGAATIEGSVGTLGSQYILQLRAVDCRTGNLITQEQTACSGKEQVLGCLGEATTRLRTKLREALPSIRDRATVLEKVTTPSLEALQTYTVGCRTMTQAGDALASIPLLERAISLDPDFAMAYARLGVAYNDTGQQGRAMDYIRKAYALQNRVSAREKLYIEAHFQHAVLGDLEAARKIYTSWTQMDPRDPLPWINLSEISRTMGEYDHALAADKHALAIAPATGSAYESVVATHLRLGQSEEAKALAQEATDHGVCPACAHLALYQVAFLEHDQQAMEREAGVLMGLPERRHTILCAQASVAASAGQFERARSLSRRAADAALLADEPENAANCSAANALWDALAGYSRPAQEQAYLALRLANSKEVESTAALALGVAGDPMAEKLALDLKQRFPRDTLVQSNDLPAIHAARELANRNPAAAIQWLAPAAAFEMYDFYPIYFRGQAFLASNQAQAAATEFEKISKHGAAVGYSPVGAMARLGEARAYSLLGDKVRAKQAYEEFFLLWKNADPDAPILKDAKEQYIAVK